MPRRGPSAPVLGPVLPFGRGAVSRVLVVVAHPDDEVLGCGGTIARHAAAGDEVHIVILGEGITSRDRQRDRAGRRRALLALGRDAHRAAAMLGSASLTLHALPDNRFDTVPLLDVVKVVERERTRVQPAIVYTHHPNDLNVDHRVTADAVQTTFRPLPGEPPTVILACEIPSSTEYQSPLLPGVFVPTVYVDVAATLARKCEAIDAYRSERRAYPHPRSGKALEIIAQRNGLAVGLHAAERFALVRAIVA